MEREVAKVLPGIDPIISEYAVGFLKHASTSTSPDADVELEEAIETVTSILIDVCAGDTTREKKVTELVDELVKKLVAANGGRTASKRSATKKLDEIIHMASNKSMSATANLMSGGIDIDAVGARKIESKVDKKKLEKAERKIKAKQDKKVMKNVEYEASKLITKPEENYDEFYMAVNPLQLGQSSAGKSKDIKVDNVDVSIAGKRILSDTSLTLAYGRRYGLVGQNGIGKSTLLRALSRRELPVPKHITILHVEQEIMGDDTPALQAVLDADVWRKHLLAEQEVCIVPESMAGNSHTVCSVLRKEWPRWKVGNRWKIRMKKKKHRRRLPAKGQNWIPCFQTFTPNSRR